MNKIATQLKSRFSRRGQSFPDEILSALIDRAILETPGLDLVALANGEASAQNDLLAALAAAPSEVAFTRTVTLEQGSAAEGEIAFTGVPEDGDYVTLNDGSHEPVTFEFDAGVAAIGTLGMSAQPSDGNTFTLGDGVHTPIFEFDSGVTGVASSNGVLTFNSVPLNNEILTLKRANGESVVFQFKTSGLATSGMKIVKCNVANKTLAALELIAAINSVGNYAANRVNGFHAWSGGAGIVNVTRTEKGAGNETIVSGIPQVETVTASGTISASGNASVVVTGAGITGSPITTPVAVVAGTKQKETATAVGTITPGTAQIETATVVGTIGGAGAGDASVVVTAAGMSNSPKTVSVAVANDDTASDVAGKIRTELGLDADITDFFTVGGSSDTVSLTSITAAANDATMNIAIDNDTCTGLTAAPTSSNTTPGVAPGTGNASVVVTAVGMTNSPKTVSVPVVEADDASAVGGKIRTALGLDADVSAFFTITGSTSGVILEAKAAAANDATMNIAIDNDTCTGLTAAPTSSNTTPGVTPDTAALWAAKVRSALGGVAAITALYDVGGSSTAISLTRKLAGTNDATLSIVITGGTAGGIFGASSVNTTAGSSGTAITVTSSFSGGVTEIVPGTGIVGGHIGVVIGTTTGSTRNHLIAAINAQTNLLFTADFGSGNNTTLRAKTRGTAGNAFTMVKSGSNLSVSGGGTFAGGLAAGSGDVAEGRTLVACGATAALSATALHTAINAESSLDITSTNSTPGHCFLANTVAHGSNGNQEIIKSGIDIQVDGPMTGGTDTEAEIISDAEVVGRQVFVTGFFAQVDDSEDWAEATNITVKTNDDGTTFFVLPQEILVQDTNIFPTSEGVLLYNGFTRSEVGPAGTGLKAKAVNNEETGGPITLTVTGVIKKA